MYLFFNNFFFIRFKKLNSVQFVVSKHKTKLIYFIYIKKHYINNYYSTLKYSIKFSKHLIIL